MVKAHCYRLPEGLREMVLKTADHCGLTESDVYRAVLTGMVRGHARSTVRSRIPEAVKSGADVFISFRADLPLENVKGKDFRRELYVRCRKELKRPAAEKIPVFNEKYVIQEMDTEECR